MKFENEFHLFDNQTHHKLWNVKIGRNNEKKSPLEVVLVFPNSISPFLYQKGFDTYCSPKITSTKKLKSYRNPLQNDSKKVV